MGKVVRQEPCLNPGCESSDALTVYVQEDGKENAWCYSCETFFHSLNTEGDSLHNTRENSKMESTKSTWYAPSSIKNLDEALEHPIREISTRKISYNTAKKYGVRVGVDTKNGHTPEYILIPRHKEDDLTGYVQKIYNELNDNSTYKAISDCKKCDLFGLNVIPTKGKKLFITEGAEDCLSVYQVLKENTNFDWEPAVIALLGASAKINDLIRNMDRINEYDEIVLVLDSDHAGKEAAQKIAKLFAGKASIVTLPKKDPNQMLMDGEGEQLKWAVLTGARKYQPDGIVNAKDCWERYKKVSNEPFYPYPDFMPKTNDMIYGIKPGTIVTITAGTGVGKTQLMRELKYHFYKTTDFKIADISLEEDVGDTIEGMLSLELNKTLGNPHVKATEEEEKRAFESLYASGRFSFYDYFGGMDDDSLFTKLRYFTSTDHKLIFLDHLSIIVSEYASEGGERERIDTIMTKLAKLVKETGAIIFLVVHLKKGQGDESFEKGTMPDLDDLRGSSTIKQLSWYVLGAARNQQHEDEYCRNIMELAVLKAGRKGGGRTGNSDLLYLNPETSRYENVIEPTNYRIK